MKTKKKTKRKDAQSYIPELKALYREGRITRRELIRNAAVLGVILGSISAFLVGDAREAAAADDPVRGGTLRTEYNWMGR